MKNKKHCHAELVEALNLHLIRDEIKIHCILIGCYDVSASPFDRLRMTALGEQKHCHAELVEALKMNMIRDEIKMHCKLIGCYDVLAPSFDRLRMTALGAKTLSC